MRYIKRIITGIATLTLSFALSQEIRDLGVSHTVDEFTRATSCSQAVTTWDFSIRLIVANHSEDGTSFAIGKHHRGYDSVFNMFGDHNPTIYFRFSEEDIIVVTTAYAYSDTDGGRDTDYAIIADDQLLYRLLSAPTDLRIRFDGSKGQDDFTLPHALIRAVAAGFGSECL